MQTKAGRLNALPAASWHFGETFNVGTGSSVSIEVLVGTNGIAARKMEDAIFSEVARWMNSLDTFFVVTAKKQSKNSSRSRGKRSSTRGRTLKK